VDPAARGHAANAKRFAKRAGTAVEEANNSCKAIKAGAISEFRGPDVPLKTLHPAR